MTKKITKTKLDHLYKKYNKREFVHPDPLEFLYRYKNIGDIEIVGLIASSLAYGRVQQILKSVSIVLGRMTPSPREFLIATSEDGITTTFADFKHRFTTGYDIAKLLIGIKNTIHRYDSLERCFGLGLHDEHDTIIPALEKFVGMISDLSGAKKLKLLPPPKKGSACKRLNLFLRWMARNDDVDVGIWKSVPLSKLVIPLDTHMHKIGKMLGLTKRNQANLRTALEISSAFRTLCPKDPVRYDFTLTRFGIRKELSLKSIYKSD